MLAAVAIRRPSTSLARRKLWCGTALAMCMSAAGPAWAQAVLPNVANAGGATITSNTTAGTMSVDINGDDRIVTYSSFNLGTPTSSSEALTFLNSGAAGSYSVLNRVTGGSGSAIYGSISAPSDITVWIVDPQGVTFGPTGSFSGGGLVVSTAQLTGADETSFLAGTLNTLNGATTAPIIFQTGSGAISASGAIVVVSQQVSVGKTITSSNGAVALVAGTDVSFTDINSPLSIIVSRGTTLAAGAGVSVGADGRLIGQSIRLAGGVDGAVTAALLQVDSGAELTATATGGSIVLATATTGDITITNSAGDTPGISSAGTLAANGANADITVTGASTVDLAGSLSAGRNIVLSSTDAAAGSVTVAGDVTTGSDYQVDARDITLGANGITTLQRAGGAIRINAGDAARGRGSLTLQSNTDSTGAEALSITAGGAIDFAPTTSLTGGTATQRADVVLTSGSTLSAGAISARAVLDSGLADLTASGAVALGNVTTELGLDITSTGGSIRTGNLASSTGGVRLDAQAGDIVSTGIAAGSDIELVARDNIRLASAISTTGGINLAATNGAVTGTELGTPATDGRPLPDYGRTNLTAATAGQTITVSAGTAQLGALSAGAGAGDLGANQIAVTAQAIDLLSATAANGHIDLEATGPIRAGTLSAGSGSTLSDVIVNATGATGAVTMTGAVTASRDYRVTGTAVALGGGTQAARGAVTIRANSGDVTGLGTLTLQSNSDGTGGEALYLDAAAGAVDLAAGSRLLGGLAAGTAAQRSDVQITSGPTLRLGDVAGSSLRTFGNATDLVSTGSIATGDVTVDQSLRIASTAGSISTGNIESTADTIRLDAQPAGAVTAGTVKAANAIDISAATDIRLASAESAAGSIVLNALAGSVGGPALGKADLTAEGAGQTIQVIAGGAARIGSVSTGSGAAQLGADQLSISAGSIDLDDATAVNGNIHLVTTSGTLRAGALTAGTPAILADVAIASAGAATVDGDISASRNYSVSGASVTLGDSGGAAVTQAAGGVLTITTGSGNVLGRSGLSLQSGGDATVNAAGAVTLPGSLSAGGNYSVTGTNITLGSSGGPFTQSAGGLLTITATGDVMGLAGLTLHSDGDVTVGATGTVELQGPVSALGSYSVTGTSVTLGDPGGSSILQSSGGLLTLTATGGDILGRAGLSLHSDLDVTVGATGAVTLAGPVSALGNYDVTGASVTLGDPGGTAVTQSASGLLTVTATSGDILGNAGLSLQSGVDLIVDASGTATLQGPVSAVRDYKVTGTGITLGDAGGAAVTQSAGGVVTVTATGGDVIGLAGLSLHSDLDVTVGATGAVTLAGPVSALGNYGVTGTSVTLGDAGGGAVTQSAGGLLTITATGGDILGRSGLSLQSGGDVTIGATGAVTLPGPVSAIGNYSVTGTGVTLGSGGPVTQSAGGILSVTATGGDVTGLAGLSLHSDSDVIVDASGAVTLQGPVSAVRDYSVTGSSVTLGDLAGPVLQSAGRFLTVTATGGDMLGRSGLSLQSGGDVTVDATGAVTLPGPVSAIGNYSVTGAGVTLGDLSGAITQSAGGLVSVIASGDIVGLGGLRLQSNSDGSGAESLTLDAGGVVDFAPSSMLLGGLEAGSAGGRSDIWIRSAPSLALGAVTGRSLRSIGDPTDLMAAGPVTLGNVTVDQALAVRTAGGAIVTGDLTVLGAGETLRLSAGGGTSDLATGALHTDGGDILLTAGRDVTAGAIRTAPAGDPATGSIAILAGRDIIASTLAAGEDIALSGGGTLAFATARAGDDIDLATSGTVSLVSAVSTGAGSDARAVQFDRTLAGQPAAIAFAGTGGQAGHNIAIRAAALTSPTPLAGETGTGLVVRSLTGGTDAMLTADQGDIRIGTIDASGNIGVAAGQGSVSGLDSSWISPAPAAGGPTLQAPGAIVLESVGTGDFTVGSAMAATISTGAGAPANLRLGVVRAGSLDLTAGALLQIDDAQITGTASLRTTGGTAGAFNLTGPALVDGHGRAGLSGADILVTAAGAAQLGTVSADRDIDVIAAAIDLSEATATLGLLSLEAGSGRLTLGTGSAGTDAILVKEDDDIGLPRTAADNLLTAGNVTAGGAVSVRSRTSAAIGTATAAAGDLTVNAKDDASLGSGTAGAGAIRILAGHDAAATTLAAEDIAVRAGNDANLGTLTAGDDLDLEAGAALTIVSGSTLGAGADNRSFAFDPALAGADTAITLAATPAADGDIRAQGGSVTLGRLDSAIGNIGITATTDDVASLAGEGSVAVHGAGKTISVRATAGNVQLGPLSAGQGSSVLVGTQIDVTAQVIDLLTATATNGALILTATEGSLTLGTGTAGGGATLVKQGSAGELTVTSLTAAQDITVQSQTSARLGTLQSTSGALALTAAGGDLTLGIGTAGGGATLVKQGTTGELTVTSLTAAQDITVQSQTSARLGTLQSGNGSIAVLAQGEVTGLTPTGAGVALDAFEDAAISAGGEVRIDTARAGDDLSIETPGAVYLVSAIADGSAGDARTITFDRTRIGQPGGIAFDAPAGIAPLASAAGSNITIRAASLDGPALTGDTDTGLVIGTLSGGGANLSSAQGDIRADTITASGGDIEATATQGSVTGRRTGFQSATGGSAISAQGQLILDVSGDVAAGSVTAGTVTNAGQATPGSIRLGSVDAGTLTLTAANGLQIDSATVSGTATLGTTGGAANASPSGYGTAAMTAQGSIAVDAAGTAQLGALQAGQITVKASAARIGSARALNGDISIEAKTALSLLGAVETVDPGRTVTLSNTGTGSTIIGGTTADNGSDIVLDNAEIALVSSGNLVIDSKARPVAIDRLTIAGNTGRTSFRILSTGAIVLGDTISGDGTGVLQIGGGSTDDPSGLVDETKLATQIAADIGDSGTRAAILLPNGTVDLRARRIVFARTGLIDRYLPANGTSPSDAAVALDVANAASPLYTSDGTGRQFLTAKRLKVSYANFALFQNTGGPNGGGVALNETAPPTVTGLALQLFGPGDRTDNSFALFGTINGFIGRGAGILPNEIIEIWAAGGNPRVVRIAQGNARLNGCVIGSPDKGCLVNDPPRPNFSIYDQRQTQLFGMADDPLLFFNPLVGRGNEGLIVDIADAPVGIDTIECDPANGPCPQGEPK